MKQIVLKLLCLLSLLVLVSCADKATPTSRTTTGGRISEREATHTPIPNHTAIPEVNTSNIINTPTHTPTPTSTPSPTPPPTPTPLPSATPTPTATPIPQLIVYVTNAETGETVSNASVFLSSEKRNSTLFSRINEQGFAYFFNLDFTVDDYQLYITADNYESVLTPLVFEVQQEEREIALAPGLYGTVIENVVNLRAGPGSTYAREAVANRGEGFRIVGRNNSGTWLVVETGNTSTAWISASSLQLNGSLTGLKLVAAPATPTPIATATPARIVLNYHSRNEAIGSFPLKEFDANEMYAQLLQWRATLSNMSNILGATTDVKTNAEACATYTGLYNSFRNSGVFYADVPLQWERADFFYKEGFIIGLDETRPAYLSCLNAGIVEQFNYGLASQAINHALDQFVISIEEAQRNLQTSQ